MKQLFLLTLLLTIVFSNTQAQVYESDNTMSQGVNNSIVVEIPEANAKLAAKEFNKILRSYKGKTKTNKRTGEIFSDNAKISEIGDNNPVDVYAQITDSETGAKAIVWFDMGGAFLSSSTHAVEYAAAENLLKNYGLSTTRLAIETELKAEERNLAKQQKELEKLKATKERLAAEIESYKTKIAQNEEAIKQNEMDQTNKNSEIENQQVKVEEVKGKLEKVGQ